MIKITVEAPVSTTTQDIELNYTDITISVIDALRDKKHIDVNYNYEQIILIGIENYLANTITEDNVYYAIINNSDIFWTIVEDFSSWVMINQIKPTINLFLKEHNDIAKEFNTWEN